MLWAIHYMKKKLITIIEKRIPFEGKFAFEEIEEIFTTEIALSNIESIEFNYVSWLNRIFRGVVFFGCVGIGLGLLLVIYFAAAGTW